jgi:hypothetical protein
LIGIASCGEQAQCIRALRDKQIIARSRSLSGLTFLVKFGRNPRIIGKNWAEA